MDSSQMKYEFLITYESIASAAAPGYTNREISIFLTEAQEDIIKETISIGLDANELTRNVVRSLRKNINLTNGSLTYMPYRAYRYSMANTIPKSFYNYHYIFNKENGETKIEVKPIPQEAILKNLKNPFKKPSEDKYWISEDNKLLYLIPPINVNISKNDILTVLYLKKPNPIIVDNLNENQAIDGFYLKTDCELDDIVARDIIYKAAKKAFAAIKDTAGYQIQNNEEKQ